MFLCSFFLVQGRALANETLVKANSQPIEWGSTHPFSQIFNPSKKCLNASLDDSTLSASSTTRITMYRLYNRFTGEHFYTSDSKERDNTVKAGWTDEGVGWIAPNTSKTPVYRLYNPYVSGGDHHYTTSSKERDEVVKAGWNDEGVGWYSVDEGEADRIEVYRQYNPYAQTGTHNYTIETKERDTLIADGWKDEGVSWYAYSSTTPSAQEIDFSKAVVNTSAQSYTGSQIKPTASITGLTKGTDYTVTYGENKDVGVGTIVITGKGEYKGSETYTFDINPVDISKATDVTLGATLTYNAQEQTQSVKSVKVGNVTLKSSDFVAVNNKATNVGNYTLLIIGTGNSTGMFTKSFDVLPLDISKASVELEDPPLVYNKQKQRQNLKSVKVGNITLSSIDFEVSENVQTNAGNYTLKVTGKTNCKGSASAAFSIAKATPTYPSPDSVDFKDLNALTGSTLSETSHLPTFDKTSGYTAGKVEWVNPNQSVGDVAGTFEFDAKFLPDDTDNYEVSDIFKLKVFVSQSLTATYVSNAPEGLTATVDGNNQETIKLEFDADTNVHTLGADSFPKEVKITSDNPDNYYFAGWAKTSDATYGTMDAQLVGTKVSTLVTYYAIWVKPSGYWLGTKNVADVDGIGEAYFAQNDQNFHSAAEIQADMTVLRDASNANYSSVKEKWKGFFDDADVDSAGVGKQVRLYATYSGGETEKSAKTHDDATGPASNLNKFVEFRIIEVSGASSHLNSDGTKDSSVVTFMATHTLPTCYNMRATDSNVGGWGSSDTALRNDIQESGSIYTRFSEVFTGNIKRVQKQYNVGNMAAQTSTPSKSTDAFWFLSYVELVGKDATNYAGYYPKFEGTQYEWCKNNVTKAGVNDGWNDSLYLNTRAGAVPGYCYTSTCSWWLRSTDIKNNQEFARINRTGNTNWYTGLANTPRAVVLCFCF